MINCHLREIIDLLFTLKSRFRFNLEKTEKTISYLRKNTVMNRAGKNQNELLDGGVSFSFIIRDVKMG